MHANRSYRFVRDAAGPWLFMLLPLALYFATASRHIGLPDSAILIDEMRAPVLSSHVNCHNLNNLVGFIFNKLPLDNIAWKSNLTSVVYGTAVVGLFHLLLLTLRVPRLIAVLSACVLMVSHSLWWHSTQAESYALSAIFLVACLLLVARDEERASIGQPPGFHLALACFLAGLSIFNHVQNGILSIGLIVYSLFCLKRFFEHRCSLLVRCVCSYLAGVSAYAIIVARDLAGGANRTETLAWMTGGGFRDLMFNYRLSHALGTFGDWVFMQFPSPFLLFIPVGLYVLARSRERRGFVVFAATVFAVNTAFFLGYETWDQFAFYLPSFICLALAGAIGASTIASKTRVSEHWSLVLGHWSLVVLLGISMLLPPLVYLNIPRWSAEPGGYWNGRYGAAHEAYKTRYDLVGMYADPIRHDRGTIEDFARALLGDLPPNAWLIDDISIYYQLQFLRTHNRIRPDLRLELIRPMDMDGWGTRVADIVAFGTLATNRIFIVATNGPCAPAVAAFNSRGRHPVSFKLSGGRNVYEMSPAASE